MKIQKANYTANHTTVIDGINARQAIIEARTLYGMQGSDFLDPHVAPSSTLKRKKGTVRVSMNEDESEGLVEYSTKLDDFTAGNFAVGIMVFDMARNGVKFEDLQRGLAKNGLKLKENPAAVPTSDSEASVDYLQYRVIRATKRSREDLIKWVKAQGEIKGQLVNMGKLSGKYVRHEDEVQAEDTDKPERVSISEGDLEKAIKAILTQFKTESVQTLVDGLTAGIERDKQVADALNVQVA